LVLDLQKQNEDLKQKAVKYRDALDQVNRQLTKSRMECQDLKISIQEMKIETKQVQIQDEVKDESAKGISKMDDLIQHFNEMTIELHDKDIIIAEQSDKLKNIHKRIAKEALRHSIELTSKIKLLEVMKKEKMALFDKIVERDIKIDNFEKRIIDGKNGQEEKYRKLEKDNKSFKK
jgi:predicted  nucleic acid-binding Zn-ribbon protein